MRRCRVPFLAVCSFFAGVSAGRPADFLRGDADVSGDLTIADIYPIFNMRWLEPPCLAALDVNGGGGIDISDVVHLLNFLFDGRSPPFEPYPELGPPDPEGPLSCHSYEPSPTLVDGGIVLDIVSRGEYEGGQEYPAMVQLSTAEFGVDAWSLAIAAEENWCSIVSATIEGTAAASFLPSFVMTELTSGEGYTGVISAAVADLRAYDDLPPEGSPHDMLALRWRPEGFGLRKVCFRCPFRVMDGLRGSGEPVVTRVVRGGSGVIPTVGNLEVDSCAFLPPRPSRGDCNLDGTFNIADPVFLLILLFQEPREPVAPLLCDADGSGGLNITDPIRMLLFLFRGGPPLPPVN